jgi:membrane-bound lytic murein transglycosylase D
LPAGSKQAYIPRVRMIRHLTLCIITTAGLCVAASVSAQETTPPAPATGSTPAPSSAPADLGEGLREVRRLLDRQTLQIEILAREINQLRRRIETTPGTGPATTGANAASAPGATPETPSLVAPTPAAPTAPAPGGTASTPASPEAAPPSPGPAPEIPRAEPTGGGVKHIVAKGETLTSISKQYNIPVAVLQKANKIQDGRKMQIGQILSIPSPTETSPDKKETP